MRLQEPYQKRPIRFLELWQDSGWRMKVYGIAYGCETPRAELVAAAKHVARTRLPQPAVAPGCYGVGFLGVHEGRGRNFVFLDWWVDENELQHHTYESPSNRPEALEPTAPGGAIACVWDLAVLSFERQAWVETTLANPTGPDLEAYLARCLSADL